MAARLGNYRVLSTLSRDTKRHPWQSRLLLYSPYTRSNQTRLFLAFDTAEIVCCRISFSEKKSHGIAASFHCYSTSVGSGLFQTVSTALSIAIVLRIKRFCNCPLYYRTVDIALALHSYLLPKVGQPSICYLHLQLFSAIRKVSVPAA